MNSPRPAQEFGPHAVPSPKVVPSPHAVPGPEADTDTLSLRTNAAPAGPQERGRAADVAGAHRKGGKGASGRTPGRDRYLDLLRALALLRVVVYHTFGWAWLTLLFPSMGVMFALAGSLMARSLQRPAISVIRGRIRRLLLPLWLYGVVILSTLAVQGWRPTKGDEFWWWARLACWIVPVGAPSFPWEIGDNTGVLEETWAVQAAGPLWYLRAYLWFVLLSPLLLRAFRRLPWATLLAPLALTAIVGTDLVTIPGETGEAVTAFAVYGSCWVLGFAHQEGMLRQLPRYVVPSIAPLFMVAGFWWATGHLGPDGWDLNDIPLANALWSFGFCLILLQLSPSWERLPGALARFDKPITLANARAVTLYLWHEVALIATIPVIDVLWNIDAISDSETLSGLLEGSYETLMFIVIWPLIGLLLAAFGWAEDVAARRRPRLFPMR